MDGSVAQGRRAAAAPERLTDAPAKRWRSLAVPGFLFLLALVAYLAWSPDRFYNHFVWQADAFLHGQTSIAYPVDASADSPGNAFFNDVLEVTDANGQPTGRGLIPFPPLPALVLVPFVAIWGLATDQQTIAGVLGVVDVGLCWWMLGRLRVRRPVRIATTTFFTFGTVFWFTAMLGTTWYFAHVVALVPLFLAVGLAVGWDRASRDDEDAEDPAAPAASAAEPTFGDELRGYLRRPWTLIDPRQVLVGALLGLAATARLTVIFGAPLFLFVGSGGSWPRRGASAALGASIPLAGLLLYNVATTGHVFHPAYDHLYAAEAWGYPSLGYHPDWSIEDPRYIPQNLGIMLLSVPALLPDQVPAALGNGALLCTEPGAIRSLLDESCPLALPRDVGTSLLLSSPAYLLLIPALRLYGRSRLVTGAMIAVLLIALVNLMHFSQGWVQWGYRFSNDFVPFALVLVAIGMERLRRPALAGTLVAASVLITFWGVYWGSVLGW